MIWVWSTLAASTGVVVKAQVAAAPDVSAPKFTVCPSASGATCKLGNLPVGQADELEATVPVSAQAGLGEELESNGASVCARGDPVLRHYERCGRANPNAEHGRLDCDAAST